MLFFFVFSPFQTSKNQIKVDLVDENFTELRGEIAGPPDTPYEGDGLLWNHPFITVPTLVIKEFRLAQSGTTLTKADLI